MLNTLRYKEKITKKPPSIHAHLKMIEYYRLYSNIHDWLFLGFNYLSMLQWWRSGRLKQDTGRVFPCFIPVLYYKQHPASRALKIKMKTNTSEYSRECDVDISSHPPHQPQVSSLSCAFESKIGPAFVKLSQSRENPGKHRRNGSVQQQHLLRFLSIRKHFVRCFSSNLNIDAPYWPLD